MIDYVYHESPPYLLVFSGFTYYHLITAHRISLDIWKPNNHPILLQKTLRRRQNDRQTQGSLWKTFTEAVPRVSTSTHSGSLPRRILGGNGYPKKTILKPSLNINNNFNHREKNVIIHPQPHSWRWVWSTISKKKRCQPRCGMEAAIHGRPGVDGTSLGTSIAKLPEMTDAGNCKWSWRMKNVGTKWSKAPQSLQCVVPF